ncbi:hypothetical protein [Sporomusa sp.]|uniref:hypothetical protein n=1 Tax=Sporomusa sp. TaxID=2078658 RepID=UPI002CDC4D8A|nr:hypothetical protein [Sporomusa sp.]HWR42549.1 hypothetical protein [Sporomusa sp.]
MGQFTKEPKAEGGYYLKYNGNYVMRQNAKTEWIRFETQDVNFNPDYFEVMDNDVDRNTVRAKFLTYKGEYVLGPAGNPYIVPYTFDFEAFIAKYKSLPMSPNTEGYTEYTYSVLFNAFRTGGIDDLQRSYDGTYGYFTPPFMSFTAAANFVYGVASNIMGVDIGTCLWGGGMLNKMQNLKLGANMDTSGEMGNNPNNPPHIRNGYNFVDSLRSHDGLSDSPVTSAFIPTSYSDKFDIETTSAKEMTTNRFGVLTLATSSQKWQDNFETILGLTNFAFVHAAPIDGYTLEYNPNGILWNVNAAGIPTAEDYDKYIEQQRIIESTNDQTIIDSLDYI